MTTIEVWLDKEDAHASSEIQWMDAYPARAQATYKQRAEKEITLATNALLRAALKWDYHTGGVCEFWTVSVEAPCTCGYDDFRSAQTALQELLEEK